MNLSPKGFLNKDAKLITPNKATMLNPNAAEFVPFALRSTFGNTKSAEPTKLDVPWPPSGKAVLDHAESSNSNNSDFEAHKHLCHQLPDDITPDFKVMGEDELQTREHDSSETSRSSATSANHLTDIQQDIYVRGLDKLNLAEKTGYYGGTFAKDQSSAALMMLATNNWDKRFINGDHQFMKGREGHNYNLHSSAGFSNSSLSERAVLDNAVINPLDILVSQFPCIAAENLADVYCANGCDLNLTIEMLTQLELQVDVDLSQKLNSKALAAPSLSTLDFDALPRAEAHKGEDPQQAFNPYGSPSSLSRGTFDFSSTVRKLASHDSDHWKYDRNGSADVGSSRIPQLVTRPYNGNGKSFLRDNLKNVGVPRAGPAWFETEEAAGHLYPESRMEAGDFARLRNVCLEQAKQAYLIGNKDLAKELSIKGNLFGLQMKSAYGKARETIYQQRNPVTTPEAQGHLRGQDPVINLHGLHVSEAIHVLKRDLSILRNTARSAGQRLQVLIYLGTGHQARGIRSPVRLLGAVEQYLKEQGFLYTQTQPDMLRVLIY